MFYNWYNIAQIRWTQERNTLNILYISMYEGTQRTQLEKRGVYTMQVVQIKDLFIEFIMLVCV